MSKRIKLTEENFEVESLIDDVISYDLKQQILTNQKIVDGVYALWYSCQKMMDSYQEQIDNITTNHLNKSFLEGELEKQLFVRRDLEDMVKFKTGKDIQEIQFMEKVKNE